MKTSKAEMAEQMENLNRWIKPGDTVYTIIRHVSSSGMTRHISVLAKMGDDFIHPNYAVSKVLEYPLVTGNGSDAVKVGGCGMDMGFHLVYNLSRRMFPNGFDCIGRGCPSNDHSNGENNKHHSDGGYALRQKWL
jgi:hypothetical protein